LQEFVVTELSFVENLTDFSVKVVTPLLEISKKPAQIVAEPKRDASNASHNASKELLNTFSESKVKQLVGPVEKLLDFHQPLATRLDVLKDAKNNRSQLFDPLSDPYVASASAAGVTSEADAVFFESVLMNEICVHLERQKGECFLTAHRAYAADAAKREHAQHMLELAPEECRDFVAGLLSRCRGNHGQLSFFTLMPMQRVVKYKQFLDELVKLTPEKNLRSRLISVNAIVKSVLMSLNSNTSKEVEVDLRDQHQLIDNVASMRSALEDSEALARRQSWFGFSLVLLNLLFFLFAPSIDWSSQLTRGDESSTLALFVGFGLGLILGTCIGFFASNRK